MYGKSGWERVALEFRLEIFIYTRKLFFHLQQSGWSKGKWTAHVMNMPVRTSLVLLVIQFFIYLVCGCEAFLFGNLEPHDCCILGFLDVITPVVVFSY